MDCIIVPPGTEPKEVMPKRSERSDRVAALEQVRRETARRERTRTAFMYGSFGLVILLLVGAVAVELRGRNRGAGSSSLSQVKTYREVSQQHTPKAVDYSQAPPAGGPHNPIWLNCGDYSQPVPNENAVHSMEHGAVWVTYRQSLGRQVFAQLRATLPDTYVVLSPMADLKTPVVATAWGKQLALSGPKDPRLAAFIRKYRQGPQTPEQGAACTGGTDGSLPLNTGS